MGVSYHPCFVNGVDFLFDIEWVDTSLQNRDDTFINYCLIIVVHLLELILCTCLTPRMQIMLNLGSIENVVAGSQLVGCALLLSYTIIVRPTHAAWTAGFAALVYHRFVSHICSTFVVFILRLGALDHYSIGNMTNYDIT